MNRYSKEQFTQRLLPSLRLASLERFGQPLCLMSPIGRKASVEWEISPSHLAHSPLPPHTTLISSMICFLGSYRRLHKNISLASLQPRKLGFRYSGSSILLDNPMTQQSGSMNRYSKELFTWRLLPGLRPASSERFGQPLCLMSPIGRKASVEREISPSHLAHSRSPPLLIIQRRRSVLNIGAIFARTSSLALLQPCKLGFHYRQLVVLAR